jgi:hypothetical protein
MVKNLFSCKRQEDRGSPALTVLNNKGKKSVDANTA